MSVRYQSAIDDGLTEDAVCSLEQPAQAEDLSAAERGAVRSSRALGCSEPIRRSHQVK
jgi:hypothetical protein